MISTAHSGTARLSILLSPAYRLTTTGIVLLVALIAFEALAVATAMARWAAWVVGRTGTRQMFVA